MAIGQGERYVYGEPALREDKEQMLANGGSYLGTPDGGESAIIARKAADNAQAAAMAAQASADAAQAILPLKMWDFGQGSDRGWTLTGATSADAEYATCRRITASDGTGAMTIAGLSLNPAEAPIIAMRVRLVSGSWRGDLLWANAGHGAVAPYLLNKTAPAVGVWTVLIFDMRSAAQGGDYMGANVTSLVFAFAAAACVLDVDWIAAGKHGTVAADLGNTDIDGVPFRGIPILARAYLSGSQTVGPNTSALAQMGNEDIDTHGAYDVGTYAFTAPAAGYYLVNCGVAYITSAGATGRVYLRLKKGSNVIRGAVRDQWPDHLDSLSFSGWVQLAAGDTVVMEIYNSDPTFGIVIQNGVNMTYMEIWRVQLT